MCRGKRWCSQPSCLTRSCLSDKGQERRPSRRVASLTRADPRYLADELVLTPAARSWRLKRLPSPHWPFFWGPGWSIKSSGLHKLRWGGHRVSWIIQDVWAVVWLRPWGSVCVVCVCLRGGSGVNNRSATLVSAAVPSSYERILFCWLDFSKGINF